MKQSQLNAITQLNAIGVTSETVIYSAIKSVAKSGLSHKAQFFIIQDNKPLFINGYLADIADIKLDEHGLIKCVGCGMDRNFAFLYNLPENDLIDFESIAQKYRAI